MEKHWLRGILLGVSLALLLAGGAAVAQGLSVTVDQDCFECMPRADYPPSEEQLVELTFSGYDPNERLCGRLTVNDVLFTEGCWDPTLPGPPCGLAFGVFCEGPYLFGVANTCESDAEGGSSALFGSNGPPVAQYGQWVASIWQEDEGENVIAGPVDAKFTFAEDCAALEFVPEPGTIALLGSGLAGLAGYATLRWKARS